MWVEAIRRYPVKSMAGQALERARLGELGVPPAQPGALVVGRHVGQEVVPVAAHRHGAPGPAAWPVD